MATKGLSCQGLVFNLHTELIAISSGSTCARVACPKTLPQHAPHPPDLLALMMHVYQIAADKETQFTSEAQLHYATELP
jgi:hypothetical protein